MAEIRSHVIIDTPADAVWAVVTDTPTIADWMPSMTASSGDAVRRTVTLADGATLVEDIVTNDPVRRRLQYRVVGGDLPIVSHLGTVDVLEIDAARTIVVYSTELDSAEIAEAFDGAISEGLTNLKAVLEAS